MSPTMAIRTDSVKPDQYGFIRARSGKKTDKIGAEAQRSDKRDESNHRDDSRRRADGFGGIKAGGEHPEYETEGGTGGRVYYPRKQN